MPDKVKPQATKTTATSKVANQKFFTVEMPGTAGQRSNYRQTSRKKETEGSDNS